jgi:hypothetical protein
MKHVLKIVAVLIAFGLAMLYFQMVMSPSMSVVPAALIALSLASELYGGPAKLASTLGVILPTALWPGATMLINHYLALSTGASMGLALLPAALAGVFVTRFANAKGDGDLVRVWVSIQTGFLSVFAISQSITELDPIACTMAIFGALGVVGMILQSELIPVRTRNQLLELIYVGSFGVFAMGAISMWSMLT